MKGDEILFATEQKKVVQKRRFCQFCSGEHAIDGQGYPFKGVIWYIGQKGTVKIN